MQVQPPTTQKSRILIVEDEPATRELLQILLTRQYLVFCATNGGEAVKILQEQAFDLVLLDIMMPIMDGLHVLQFIRSNSATKNIPVIMISAMIESEHVVQGLKLGANDYITKPMDLSVVMARVNTQLTIKRLMDERQKTIEELNTTQEMRSRLFHIAKHDLKNPLTNIRMIEYLLREQLSDSDPETIDLLDSISKSIDTMKNVLDNFLSVATLKDGEMELKIETIAVDQIIWDIVRQFGATAGNKDISLEVGNLDGYFYADSSHLTQVLNNLVSNAIKYSPTESTIAINSKKIDQYIRICIADQGPGIPEKERHLLFNEFSQLSPRPTGEESSTGLGLWIVKHLTTAMSGVAGADFPKEGGSIFWVQFPAV